MKTAYYAHSMSTYGAEQESKDIEVIESMGFKCLNPAVLTHTSMDEYCRIAANCDILIFRAFKDGNIGSGVAKEIEAMRAAGKPVLELSHSIAKRILTRAETRMRIAAARGEKLKTSAYTRPKWLSVDDYDPCADWGSD